MVQNSGYMPGYRVSFSKGGVIGDAVPLTEPTSNGEKKEMLEESENIFIFCLECSFLDPI